MGLRQSKNSASAARFSMVRPPVWITSKYLISDGYRDRGTGFFQYFKGVYEPLEGRFRRPQKRRKNMATRPSDPILEQ
jgi:hypothetical protein